MKTKIKWYYGLSRALDGTLIEWGPDGKDGLKPLCTQPSQQDNRDTSQT